MELNISPEQLDKIIAWTTEIGIKALTALAVFLIGKWVAGLMRRGLERVLTARKVDVTIVKFLGHMGYMILLTLVVLVAIERLGVKTTSFVAVIGAAGLAIGLALQGSLSNFASGVLLIIFRPFKAGDFIEAGGSSGIVEEIQVFCTQMRTPDNKEIIIPNSSIMGGSIVNYSAKATRRVEVVAGIGYDDDIKKAKNVLHDIAKSDERVLADPEPAVAVVGLGDSSVNISLRVWVKSADYWPVLTETTEAVKLRFDAEGISIPYPQRDIHMHQSGAK